MSENETKTEKLYYSIGEVADMFKVNSSLIRYWEKEFSIIKPQKNKKGNRFFTKSDIENFHLIYNLVKERGMTLKGAKQKLKENKGEAEYNFKIIQSLKQMKSLLVDIKDSL